MDLPGPSSESQINSERDFGWVLLFLLCGVFLNLHRRIIEWAEEETTTTSTGPTGTAEEAISGVKYGACPVGLTAGLSTGSATPP